MWTTCSISARLCFSKCGKEIQWVLYPQSSTNGPGTIRCCSQRCSCCCCRSKSEHHPHACKIAITKKRCNCMLPIRMLPYAWRSFKNLPFISCIYICIMQEMRFGHAIIHLKCMSWKAHPRGVSAMFRLVGEGLGLGRMNEITLNGAVGTHILVVASWRQLPVPEVFAGIGRLYVEKGYIGYVGPIYI